MLFLTQYILEPQKRPSLSYLGIQLFKKPSIAKKTYFESNKPGLCYDKNPWSTVYGLYVLQSNIVITNFFISCPWNENDFQIMIGYSLFRKMTEKFSNRHEIQYDRPICTREKTAFIDFTCIASLRGVYLILQIDRPRIGCSNSQKFPWLIDTIWSWLQYSSFLYWFILKSGLPKSTN